MDRAEEPSDLSSYRQGQDDLDRQRAWEQLTGRYLSDLPRQLREIQFMLQAGDYTAVKGHAHRVKGTAATYRLGSIARGFAQLEQLAESGDLQAMRDVLDRIMRMVELEAANLASRQERLGNDSQKKASE